MTVDEKRKLELKTMYQIIGIYCHNKHHTPKGQLCHMYLEWKDRKRNRTSYEN